MDAMSVIVQPSATPEIMPEDIEGAAAIIATGRSATPTRSTTCSPSPARSTCGPGVNEEIKLAASRAIAAVIGPRVLDAEYIVPTPLNRDVAPAVAAVVAEAAVRTGVARHAPASPVTNRGAVAYRNRSRERSEDVNCA
jgi:malate dehydrogenase (oxaloacetate-decarboxylating)